MKLKFYLRGLGAGILFSVLVFVFVVGPKSSDLSDEEIIARAKELGLVEKTEKNIDMEKLRENTATPALQESTLTGVPASTDTPTPSVTPTATNEPTPTVTPTATNEPTPTGIPIPTSTPIPTDVPIEDEPVPDEVIDAVVIKVVRGMTSEQICYLIENNGLIANALELNAYLIQNGYAEQLRVGEFTLYRGMTFDEIAKQLTK